MKLNPIKQMQYVTIINPLVMSDNPDQTITEGSSFTTIHLDDYVTDEDPDFSIT
jgi:hypothetical protein